MHNRKDTITETSEENTARTKERRKRKPAPSKFKGTLCRQLRIK
jgi:hypothetical protein